MNKDTLLKLLTSKRLSKSEILELVDQLYKKPQLVGVLLHAIWIEDKDGGFNASWVFDHLMRKNLDLVLPFIRDFVHGIKNLTSESCIRPMAHSTQMLMERYFIKKDPNYIKALDKDLLDILVEVCFDWLLEDHKVATKVFSMTSLYHLGARFSWIHPELKSILQKTITQGTAGYQNRAAKLLDKLLVLGV